MKTATINLPFAVTLDSDGNGFSYVQDNRVSVSCYAKNGAAVKRLKEGLAREVSVALDNKTHYQKCAIATKAGEVFIVEYSNGWMYSIVGPGRGYAGSTMGNWKTFD